MKRLIILIPLLFACKKEQQQKSQCDCYKQYQINNFGYYENTTQSSIVQDSCSLDGQIVEYETYKRYVWVCN